MSFLDSFCADLPAGVALAPEIVALIKWLEGEGQHYKYRRTDISFLATHPVAGIDELTSHVVFQSNPDMVRYWLGRDDLGARLVPIVRCGGDGSMLAIWQPRAGHQSYVFLGSEGESFVVADDPVAFILVVTMGYETIEGRYVLAQTPEEAWADGRDAPWPDPVTVKAWVEGAFAATYPDRAEEILPSDTVQKAYSRWLDAVTKGEEPE